MWKNKIVKMKKNVNMWKCEKSKGVRIGIHKQNDYSKCFKIWIWEVVKMLKC